MRGPAKILLVDDEDLVRRNCRSVLAADGHEVCAATTGEEALHKIENGRFDIAVLDLKMAGRGGLRVLRAIRRASPRTEVLVTTGCPSIENAKESIRLGAFEYMSKPFAPQILRMLVSQVLECKPWKMHER
jgi:DNA-binding NtrC family response regulator